MFYLVAIFAAPLALLFAGKYVPALINLIIYILAGFGIFLFVIPGILLWIITVIHAFVVISNKNADKRTQQVVEAIQSQK